MCIKISEEKRVSIINSICSRKELITKIKNFDIALVDLDELGKNLNMNMLLSSTSKLALKYYIDLLDIVSKEEAMLVLSVTLEKNTDNLPEVIAFLIIKNIVEITEKDHTEKQ